MRGERREAHLRQSFSGQARGKLKVKRLTKLTPEVLLELESFENKVFGDGGLNRWALPVIAKYGYLFILLIDEKISGSVTLICNKKTAFLVGLWISKSLRNQGLGEKLLKKVIDEIKNSGIKNVELTVQEDNKAARKLYQKVGFKLMHRIENFYGPSQTRLLLRCNLLK